VQERLRGLVVTEDRFGPVADPVAGPVARIAALDAHYSRRAGLTWAAAVAVRWPDLELLESVLVYRPTRFPYVPGLLSFREAPAMLDALALLSAPPDLLLVDGQGIAHPRRLGLAAHVGLLADLPTIGVAKSRLVGNAEEPARDRGAHTPLTHRGETIGAVLRTRTGTRPLYVSTGHRVALSTAVDWVLRCTPRYRLPEPIRLADALSRAHPPDAG